MHVVATLKMNFFNEWNWMVHVFLILLIHKEETDSKTVTYSMLHRLVPLCLNVWVKCSSNLFLTSVWKKLFPPVSSLTHCCVSTLWEVKLNYSDRVIDSPGEKVARYVRGVFTLFMATSCCFIGSFECVANERYKRAWEEMKHQTRVTWISLESTDLEHT